MNKQPTTDVAIIGAGPSGSVAACLLRKLGYAVTVLEKSTFPRFVIGESLLPQCLTTLQQAGCLDAVISANFQKKIGATFQHQGHYENIIFDDKFSAGPSHAFHVERAEFDQILADCAIQAGAEIIFNATVTQIENKFNNSLVEYLDADGDSHQIKARFILDASGYGRVLPRLLGIDKPSSLDPKASLFTHLEDGIPVVDESQPDYHKTEQHNAAQGSYVHNRTATLITTHPKHRDVWFWLISFNNGRSSVGVVGHPELIEPYQADGIHGLKAIIGEDPELSRLLSQAKYDSPAMQVNAYSGNVTQFHGNGYAILGNAGEFLDPIFSSGVTVAIHSSKLAVEVLDNMFKGQDYDWQKSFVDPLKLGVQTFKAFVTHWYTGGFQDVIYSPNANPGVKAKIASILAGYAWDLDNPYVRNPEQRLQTLINLCQED